MIQTRVKLFCRAETVFGETQLVVTFKDREAK